MDRCCRGGLALKLIRTGRQGTLSGRNDLNFWHVSLPQISVVLTTLLFSCLRVRNDMYLYTYGGSYVDHSYIVSEEISHKPVTVGVITMRRSTTAWRMEHDNMQVASKTIAGQCLIWDRNSCHHQTALQTVVIMGPFSFLTIDYGASRLSRPFNFTSQRDAVLRSDSERHISYVCTYTCTTLWFPISNFTKDRASCILPHVPPLLLLLFRVRSYQVVHMYTTVYMFWLLTRYVLLWYEEGDEFSPSLLK